jgi:hypothetical protein
MGKRRRVGRRSKRLTLEQRLTWLFLFIVCLLAVAIVLYAGK